MQDGEATTGEAAKTAAEKIQHLDRLPKIVADSLTDAQREAVEEALAAGSWGKHPIDIRTTLPFVGGRVYFTLVTGRESRSDRRRAKEAKEHPFFVASNTAFSVIFLFVFLVGAMTIFMSILQALGIIAFI